MRDRTVLVFGAGATKDCGGALTKEILPQAFAADPAADHQQKHIQLLAQFLDDMFPFEGNSFRLNRGSDPLNYPPLPLLLSLIDTAIDRKQPLTPQWPIKKIAEVREAVEAAIYSVLDFRSPYSETTSYDKLLAAAYPTCQTPPAVISLNYDMILDAAMFNHCDMRKPGSVPSYGCDIRSRGDQTTSYQCRDQWGCLLKIHGSVNWMYCSQCLSLELAWSKSRGVPSRVRPTYFRDAEDQYAHRAHCQECMTHLRPILITPTHRKDYRNPHLARIWYDAERLLQQANRVIFVGYGLPDDDVEVIYLLKRGLGASNPDRLPGRQITVIEKMDDQHPSIKNHPVGQRYRTLFGDDVDFRTEGFTNWLNSCAQCNPGLVPGLPARPTARRVQSPACRVLRHL
jgi:hypothetical protein